MAKRQKTEFPEPNHGMYPGFVESIKDKTITKRSGETMEMVEFDWTYIENGDVMTATDLTSQIFTDNSNYGKRYNAIVGTKSLPDGFDDSDMLHKPCFLSWGPNSGGTTAVIAVSRMTEQDLDRYPRLRRVLQIEHGLGNRPVPAGNAQEANDEDAEDIPF